MKDIGTRLQDARIKKGLNQGELAELLQCSSKAISRYENNDNLGKVYDFVKMCECLDADINYIATGIEKSNGKEITLQEQQILYAYRGLSDSEKRIVDFILEIEEHDAKADPIVAEPITIYRFPKYEQKAAAGVGQLGRDSNYSMKEYIVDGIPDEAVYAMEIAGESMNHEDTDNLIHTGSIVLINPRFIDSELDNKIVIANFNGQIICKRYINKGEYILFQSDNDAFKSENRKSSDDPDCKVLGVVLGVVEGEKFVKVK